MADKKTTFQLEFPENLKKDISLSSTPKLSFDDLGDFIEEREKIRRLLEQNNEAELKVDYSQFANHVFFDSAASKYLIAQDRILTKYPYNGNTEEKDAHFLTSSGYETFVYEQWPRYVGNLKFSGSSQYMSATDYDKKLVFGTSSLMLSCDVNLQLGGPSFFPLAVSIHSGATSSGNDAGFRIYFSASATDAELRTQILSGSTSFQNTVAYLSYTGSWHNVAMIYDRDTTILSTYIDGNRITSGAYSAGPIEQNDIRVLVGGGNNIGYGVLSGSIDNVRLFFTASELLLQKTISRPINSEDYVKLNYTFNEGTVGTASVDLNVVDYSKSSIHGVINAYTENMRVSGSSRYNDPGDPILYSFHSGVLAFSGTNVLSASDYDRNNNNQIFNMIPEYLLNVDEQQEGLMISFSLALARFFDELKLYIDQFDNLRVTNYDDLDETPDIFLPFLTRYFGWKVTEHFGDSNPLSFFFGDGVKAYSSGTMDVSLLDIRNQFWRRILNNLPYLLKTKGKRYNVDAFFNVLGINKENINLKEYGYLPGGSILDTRIHKEKVNSFLGIGTGSLSSSFVKVPTLITGTNNSYTVEALMQLPYQSASYSASLSALTGGIWQLVDPNQVTGSFALLWNVPSLGSSTGKFILTGSDGQKFSSSLVSVFDGDFVFVAAGLRSNQLPFIEVRTLDNDTLDFTGSYSGSVALSGVFTGSKWDFIMGATSGTFFQKATQGYYGHYRYWNRALSSSEINDHALNFESVGIDNPAEFPHPLRGYWPLNENLSSSAAGVLTNLLDLSRNRFLPTGSQFPASFNPYKKFLVEYNYLSPSIDLRWTENKIRIRNKTELLFNEVATDTNEVALEFNLVDALNRDITKIFSTFNLLNNAIGSPVNKYRDEYSDLEAYRRVYFDRLGDSIYFTDFFKLFRWFDKKISDSIKQLLPTRVRFIGGEQVVESHFLERPKYQYQYPIFRTPKTIPEAVMSSSLEISSSFMSVIEATAPFVGTSIDTAFANAAKIFPYSGSQILPRQSSMIVEADINPLFLSTYSDGEERIDRNPIGRKDPFFVQQTTLGTTTAFGGMLVDISGNIYWTNLLTDGWRTMKSHITASTSWVLVDNPFKTWLGSTPRGHDIAMDSSGAIYVCGFETSSSDYAGITFYMSVRKAHASSSNATGSWSTVDKYPGTHNTGAFANSITVDANDNIYVVGSDIRSGFNQWIIRKSTDRGQTWANVYTPTGSTAGGVGNDIITDSSGNVFAAGYESASTISGSVYEWFVRRSVDAGASWENVDNFFSIVNHMTGSVPHSIAVDKNDVVFVGGFRRGMGGGGVADCTGFIRSSSAHGDSGSWAQVEENNDRLMGQNSFNAGYFAMQRIGDYIWAGGEKLLKYTNSGRTGSWLDVSDIGLTGSNAVSFVYGLTLDIAASPDNKNIYLDILPLNTVSSPSSVVIRSYVSESISRAGFYRRRSSGDDSQNIYKSETGINFKNEFARRLLSNRDRDNE